MTVSTISVNPAFLAEPFTLLAKSINQAFVDLESRYSQDIAKANADISEHQRRFDTVLNEVKNLRRERDAAIKTADGTKEEIMQFNVDLQKAESTILVQAESIQQLKREAAHWKDHARNWQDHFLKVEQDRCAMNTRIDELVNETRMANRGTGRQQEEAQSTTPTPNLPESVLSSSTTRRASLSNRPRSANQYTSPSHPSKKRKSQSKVRTRDAVDTRAADPGPSNPIKTSESSVEVPELTEGSASSSSAPSSADGTLQRPILLRRVNTTIELKVKDEEESDNEESILQAEREAGLAYQAQKQAAARLAHTQSPSKRKASRKSIEQDYEEEQEASDSPVPASRRQPSKKRRLFPSDDEQDIEEESDDDLLLHSQSDNTDVFDSAPIPTTYKPPPAPPRRSRPQTGTSAAQRRKSLAESQARKPAVRAR